MFRHQAAWIKLWTILVGLLDGGGEPLRRIRSSIGIVVAVGLGLMVVSLALVISRQRSAVDWCKVRAVVLESDDWGLCGFVPDSTVWS